MAIRFACPGCKTVHAVDDALKGQPFRCPCGKQVRVPQPAAAAPATRPRANGAATPAAPPASKAEQGVRQAPARPAAPAPRPRHDEDADEAPRGKPSRGGLSPALLIGGGLGALAIITAGVVTVILVTRSDSPAAPRLPDPQALVLNVKADKGGEQQARKDPGAEQPRIPEQKPVQTGGEKLEANEIKGPVTVSSQQPVVPQPPGPVAEQPKAPAPEQPKPPAPEQPNEPVKDSQPPAAPVAGPGGGQLDRATLQKLKDATLYLRVTQPDGAIAQGSGFFGLAPGLVLTNAHVLGMLSAEGRRPTRVEAVYRSGLPGSRTFVAEILGVDRSSDLALLRVTGDGLPAPLDVRSAKELVETQTVYIVGFPFGDSLGKNVTISTSSVSSLRTDALGMLRQVQVNGGMHPGNSGGPVVTSKGEVIGVAVSGIRATQINFAVPGDFVHVVLNGRVTSAGFGQAYRDGGQVKLPVNVELLDPLGKASKPSVNLWTGNPGKPRGPSATEPAPQPGDSPLMTVELPYDGKGKARGEFVLPPLPPGKTYWYQPSYVNAAGKKFWVAATTFRPTAAVNREPAELALRHQASSRSMDLESHSTLRLFPPGGQVKSVTMSMKTRLGEQTQPAAKGAAVVTLNYLTYKMGIAIDGKPPPTSPQLQRIVKTIRLLGARMLVDAQGNVKLNQVDVSRVPAFAREDLLALHDQIGDSLEAIALPAPNRLVRPKETWQTVRRLPVTVGSGVEKAVLALTLTYEGTLNLNGRKMALIDIVGRVHGVQGRELRVSGRATGRGVFDLERGQFAVANLTVVVELDVSLRGESLRVTGTLDTRLHRDFKPAAVSPIGQGRNILTVNGELVGTEPSDRVLQKSFHKAYPVQLNAGRTYVIEMKAQKEGFDPFLRLEGPDGNELANDDDSGGGLDARMVYRPAQPGGYRIICTTFKGGQTGRFSLTVKELIPARGKPGGPPLPKGAPQTGGAARATDRVLSGRPLIEGRRPTGIGRADPVPWLSTEV